MGLIPGALGLTGCTVTVLSLTGVSSLRAGAGTCAASASQPQRPPLTVRLVKPARIELAPQPPVTEPERARIRGLIAALAKIETPDFGFSPTTSGHAFAPVKGTEHAGTLLMVRQPHQTFPAFRQLVQLGPRALPFLLEALSNTTPTRLTIKHDTMMGAMWFDRELWGNPADQVEQRVLDSAPRRGLFGRGPTEQSPTSYTVRVGDVCFVAIGQIVGREYQAVRYQPTMCVVINSPVQDPMLARQVRTIWSSKSPAHHLLNTLLRDYHTQGIFNGRSLDGWDVGSRLQVSAVMRLLYYFPRQTAPMIARRLSSLRVYSAEAELDGFMRREVANRVRTAEFVKAVAWCQEPQILTALRRIFNRTTDSQILLAALPAIQRGDSGLVKTRVEHFLHRLPATELGPYGDGYELLVALGRSLGAEARPAFRQYLGVPSVQRRHSMCKALRELRGAWTVELLVPLLIDKRPLDRWTYSVYPGKEEPSLPIRVCDEAAETINLRRPDLPFRMAGTHADLDRQITAMRERIRRKRE
jgi:hypothetical protein